MRPASQVGDIVIQAMIRRAACTPEGSFVEVGVFQGGTAWHLDHLAQAQLRNLYLYDTFTGMPYSSSLDVHKVGDFSATSLESVQKIFASSPRTQVIAGLFPDSAVPMGPLAFVHLDCDQYKAYHESIEYLKPLMVPGGVMWFDDSPCLGSAKQAVEECFKDREILMDCGKHYVVF